MAKTNDAQVRKVFKQIDKDLDWVIITALNKTATAARTHINRFIRKEYTVKAKDINTNVKIKRARRNRPVVTVMLQDRPIGLFSYKTRVKKRRKQAAGVVYTIQRGGASREIEQGFFAEFSGFKGAFIRKGQERGPLKKLFGPTSGQLFKSKSVQEELMEFLEREFYKKLQQQIKYKFN